MTAGALNNIVSEKGDVEIPFFPDAGFDIFATLARAPASYIINGR
jgi:hypothetical protein